MASDWDMIIVLSVYAVLLSSSVIAYNISFNPDGTYHSPNSSYNMSGLNASELSSSATEDTGSLGFLKALSFGLPTGASLIFISIFEVLPGGYLGLLIYRLLRSGGG